MRIVARAPGKLVILGEYAVLTGAEALVMAVNRRVTATLESPAEQGTLVTRAPAAVTRVFAAGAAPGVPLVDLVLEALGQPPEHALFSGELDSSEFFFQGTKLGLGSSAAALVAFVGGWAKLLGLGSQVTDVNALIALHRRFQGGAGSGLDVAAAALGGVLRFRLTPGGQAEIGSVRLPNGVGFAGVFPGVAAATPDFIAHFHAWRQARSAGAAALLDALGAAAAAGGTAAAADDSGEFLRAIDDYGSLLEQLGDAMGRPVLTPEHREIRELAGRFGVKYKVSGAGGGDLGLAFSDDRAALARLQEALAATRYQWVDLQVDPAGLVSEESVE